MSEVPFFNFNSVPRPLQSGNVLISVPLSGDLYFARTVILLITSNEKGTLGIMLNKSLPISIYDIYESKRKNNKHIPVFIGGPVDIDRLFVLHAYGDLMQESLPVTKDVFFGGSSSELSLLLQDDLLDESLIRFYLGYTGWSGGQLESEIERKLWVVGNFDKKLIFHQDDDRCWREAVLSLGEDFSSWLYIAADPSDN
jgi:putative transcriptional regulator